MHGSSVNILMHMCDVVIMTYFQLDHVHVHYLIVKGMIIVRVMHVHVLRLRMRTESRLQRTN